MRSPRRTMAASVLVLEAIALGLVTPVLITVAGVGTATGLVTGLGLALGCLVVAGLLRFSWAYALGWALQVAALALGLLVPLAVVLAVCFGVLWGTADVLGRRLEREQAGSAGGGVPGAEPAR